QVPSQHTPQRHQVGRSIPLSVLLPTAQLVEQEAQPFLHVGVSPIRALEAREQGSHEQPLLGLSHIIPGLGLTEPILDEEREPTLHNLLAGLGDQVRAHVLQHHRLRRKAARSDLKRNRSSTSGCPRYALSRRASRGATSSRSWVCRT